MNYSKTNSIYSLVFVGIILVATIYGCGTVRQTAGSEAMTPQSYLTWYGSANCPLRDTVVAKDVRFTLEQVPLELELARNVQTKRMTKEEAKTAYSDSKNINELTYILSVQLPVAGKDIFSYNLKQGEQGRKEYVSFELKKDLYIVTVSGDTIDCTRTLYEQGISNSPRSRFIIDFATITREKAARLLFVDKLWSEQTITFDLTGNRKAVLPRLEL